MNPQLERLREAVVDLHEAGSMAATRDNGGPTARRRVTLIRAGWGSSGFYSRHLLGRDGPAAFPVGTHMYLNHPSLSEESDRPERDVRDLAGRIATTPTMEGDALVAEAEVFSHWAPVVNALADDIGLSIRAHGTAEPGEEEGRQGPVVTAITEGISVDFVTKAGAGGEIGDLIESARTLAEITRRPWDGSAGRFTDEQWARSCVLDRGEDAGTVKQRFGLPVREPDGELNCRAVANARARISQVQAPEAAIARARSRLESLARQCERATEESLREARNVAQWLEARIHTEFTQTADGLFANGHLAGDERIALSSAIGDALSAFSTAVAERAPALYSRDPFADPESDNVQANEEEKEEDMNENKNENESERLAQLEEKLAQHETRIADAERERDEAAERAERAENDLLAQRAARIVDEALAAEADDGENEMPQLPGRARNRVRETVLRETLPLTEDGNLDKDTLVERTVKAAKEEADYLGEPVPAGRVTGMGPSGGSGDGGGDAEEKLAEAFGRLGMSESGAKIAAAGR